MDVYGVILWYRNYTAKEINLSEPQIHQAIPKYGFYCDILRSEQILFFVPNLNNYLLIFAHRGLNPIISPLYLIYKQSFLISQIFIFKETE